MTENAIDLAADMELKKKKQQAARVKIARLKRMLQQAQRSAELLRAGITEMEWEALFLQSGLEDGAVLRITPDIMEWWDAKPFKNFGSDYCAIGGLAVVYQPSSDPEWVVIRLDVGLLLQALIPLSLAVGMRAAYLASVE